MFNSVLTQGKLRVTQTWQPQFGLQSISRDSPHNNVDIRHIPGKKNPANSLSRQLVTDALVWKISVKDANAKYVQKLRVSENATNEEIQTALHNLFNRSPQGNSNSQGPQGAINLMNEDSSSQGTISRSIIATIAISKIQLDDKLKILCSLLFRMKVLTLKF